MCFEGPNFCFYTTCLNIVIFSCKRKKERDKNKSTNK
uniref:Uncharacterized protein n=1 Tax=Anguilla anguilla TaxID=7936 RepID=A0A0E9S2V3_ANGAN